MQRFVAAWAGWPRFSRLRNIDPSVVAIICSGYSDEAALAEFLQYGFRGALPKPFTPARSSGCIATRRYDLEKRAGVRPLALAQLFQRGNDGARSALDVAEEIRHSLTFGVQYDQGRKTFDFIFAGQFHVLLSDRVALRFGTRKIEFNQNQILRGVLLELRFWKKISACMSLQ